jgi:hypothetical protein
MVSSALASEVASHACKLVFEASSASAKKLLEPAQSDVVAGSGKHGNDGVGTLTLRSLWRRQARRAGNVNRLTSLTPGYEGTGPVDRVGSALSRHGSVGYARDLKVARNPYAFDSLVIRAFKTGWFVADITGDILRSRATCERARYREHLFGGGAHGIDGQPRLHSQPIRPDELRELFLRHD